MRKAEFLAAGEARKAVFGPNRSLAEGTHDSSGFPTALTWISFCNTCSPSQEKKKKKKELMMMTSQSISRCFEPGQPVRFISGLSTTFIQIGS